MSKVTVILWIPGTGPRGPQVVPLPLPVPRPTPITRPMLSLYDLTADTVLEVTDTHRITADVE